MQCDSALSITKLLKELTSRDVAIKAAEHETKTRGKQREREILVHLNNSCEEKSHLNIVLILFNIRLRYT